MSSPAEEPIAGEVEAVLDAAKKRTQHVKDPGVLYRRKRSDDKEQAKVQVLGLIRQGKSLKEAAAAVGRSEKTIYTWKYESIKFAKSLEAAQEAWLRSQDREVLSWREKRDELIPIRREDYPSWATYVAAFRKQYFGFDTFDHQWRMYEAMENAPGGGVTMVLVPPAWTKALDVETLIPTPSGFVKMADLRVGDWVFGGDGKPAMVTAKSDVKYSNKCYEVTADDGASVVADAGHLWPVRLCRKRPHVSVVTTETLAKERQRAPRLAMAGPVEYPEANLPLDPYILGAWLGDGATAGARMYIGTEDRDEMAAQFEARGYPLTPTKDPIGFGVPGLAVKLRELGVLGAKHVPEVYMTASVSQRRDLLAGLIDTDGCVEKCGRITFTSTKRELAEAVLELARSLGARCGFDETRATLNGRDCGQIWRARFYMEGAPYLARKAARSRETARSRRRLLTVREVETRPVQCIAVDSPDHTYLAGRGYLLTHNTTTVCDASIADLCDDPNFRNAFISGDLDFARRTMARVARRLEGDGGPPSLLMEHFGPFKPDGVRSKKWNSDEITLLASNHDEQDPSVISVGIKGRIRGYRWDRVYLDDIQSLNTLGETAKFIDLFRQDVLTRPGKQGKIIIFGNRVGRGDFYEEMLRLDLVDELVIIPALDLTKPLGKQSNFPRQYRTAEGAVTTDPEKGVEPIVDEKGDQMGWDDEDLDLRREKVGEDQWSRVYMMEPESDYSAMVTPEEIANATDVDRRVGAADERALAVMCGLDPSLHNHAFLVAAGYDSSRLYVYDAIDRFKLTTNQRLFGEVRDMTRKYNPNWWVIENNTLQSGYLTDDAFLALRDEFGFRAVGHHTGGEKKDAVLGIPAMMEAIRRGEIRFPRIGVEHEGFTRLFDQLMAWRPDKPTKMLVQDGVMALWFVYLLWKRQRDAIISESTPIRRKGLARVTLYPWAKTNLTKQPAPAGARSTETYGQQWDRLRENAR